MTESLPTTDGTAKENLVSRIVAVFLRGNLSVLLIVITLAVGALALLKTPREEDPQIVVPMADVFVQVPGAECRGGRAAGFHAAGAAALPDRRRGVRLLHVAPGRGDRHRAVLRRREPRGQPGQALQQDLHEHGPGPAGRDGLGGQAGGDRRRADRQRHALERPYADDALRRVAEQVEVALQSVPRDGRHAGGRRPAAADLRLARSRQPGRAPG